MLHLLISGHDRRSAPKFGKHVRIDTLTLNFFLTHPTPGGFRGLSIVKNLSRRTGPKFGTHVRIDTLTWKQNLTHPTRGGGRFRGLSIVKNLSQQTAPKFGTHVRIDTLTLNKKLTHSTPGGFRGLSIGDDVATMFVGGSCIRFTYLFRDTTVGPHPHLARMCG